jgi:hypothetical protein
VRNFRHTLAHLFHPRRSNNHRPRVLHPEAYFYYILIALGFAGLIQLQFLSGTKLGGVLGFASSITPAQVVEQTNAQRAQVGLGTLTLNATLSQAALSKAQDMFSNQYWAHTSPAGKEPWTFMREAGYAYQVAGENLARDFSTTGDMMAAWMASPTHKANIVNGKYQEIGIAVVDGELQGVQTTLVVQMFGTRRSASVQVSSGKTAAAPKPAEAIKNVLPAQNQAAQEVASPVPTAETDASPEVVPVELATNQNVNETVPTPLVLARALVPVGNLSTPPLFSPLQLTKAFFLAVILFIILTLVYDGFVIGHQATARLVGKNLGHIIFLTCIAFLLILFRGGIVG